ncbi:hypothetical protein D3C80_2093190 [compost metagenome]
MQYSLKALAPRDQLADGSVHFQVTDNKLVATFRSLHRGLLDHVDGRVVWCALKAEALVNDRSGC